MEKTIKEIADSLGVDKQKVYRYIKKNHIKSTSEAHHEALQGNAVKRYDEAAIQQIAQGLSENHITSEAHQGSTSEAHQKHVKSASSDTVSEALVDLLRHELEVKDNQIAELNNRLAEVTAALREEQQRLNAAQALHAGTIQATLEAGGSSEPSQDTVSHEAVQSEADTPAPRKSWLARLLGL